MLRILSFAAATAAMLVIPFTEADARRGHGGGMGVSHSMGARSIGGPRIGSVGSFKSVHVGPRRVAFIGPHFRHRRHFFGGFYAVGLYDSCWRWVPTVYGLRRVWVCDPYSYY
jgi:hypothetical protein